MKSIFKGMCLFIAVGILLSIAPVGAEEYQSEALNNLQVSRETDLGYPFTSTQFVSCTFSKQDGRDVVYTSATGKPATFIGYDLVDRKVIVSETLVGAHTVWSHGTDSKGNVYIATQSEARMFKWDPVEKKLTNYGKIVTPDGVTQTALYGITFDSEDNAYVGTYPSGYLVRLNATTQEYDFITNQMCPGDKYIRSVLVHGDYLYAMGNSQSTSFSRYNLKTGKIEYLTLFEKDGSRAITCQGMVSAEDYLICYIATDAGKSFFAVYKIAEDKWFTDDDMLVPPSGFYASPVLNGKSYMVNSADKKLYTFDVETEKIEMTDLPASGFAIRGANFYEFDDPELPGTTMITVQQHGVVSYYSLDLKKFTHVPVKTEAQPTEIRSLAKGLTGTNTVAIGSYMNTRMGILNEFTNEITYLSHQQIEGMGEAHGEFYTGGYPGCNLATIDYDKYTRNVFASLGDQLQDRPFAVIEAGPYTAFSSVPNYGVLGGALILIDPKTKETEVFANIIKNQSIIGMEYKDGKIYATTGIWGGLGIDPTERNAKIFVFDLATKKVIKEVAPDLENVKTEVMHMGDIKFAKDGSLWSVARGVVFELDPETLDVKREILIRDQLFSVSAPRYIPYCIRWLNDTVMVTSAGDYISVLDITTGEFKTLVTGSSAMALSENNNVYYTSSNRTKLFRMAINVDNDMNQYMRIGTASAIPAGFERIPYKSFGFFNMKLSNERELKSEGAVLADITLSDVSNSNKHTGSIRYGKKGIYNDVNLDISPQNVTMDNVGGMNTIKITAPVKGFPAVLELPIVEFDDTYTREGRYKFIADVYAPLMEEVSVPEKIDLESVPAKVNGKPQLEAYAIFEDAFGTNIGATEKVYLDPAEGWQALTLDVEGIPDAAALMKAHITIPTHNATAGTHIASPAFYMFNSSEYSEKSITKSAIMFIDKPDAYVNLFRFRIDKGDDSVTPFVKASRTLVPIRFLSESLGAKVSWDEEAQAATITKDKTVIKIRNGENSIDINGNVTQTDAAAVIENGRAYLPMRIIAEALGKFVFWDERGLIVITDGEVLDPQKDGDLIDTIISYFE